MGSWGCLVVNSPKFVSGLCMLLEWEPIGAEGDVVLCDVQVSPVEGTDDVGLVTHVKSKAEEDPQDGSDIQLLVLALGLPDVDVCSTSERLQEQVVRDGAVERLVAGVWSLP